MARSEGNARVRGLAGWELRNFSQSWVGRLRILAILGQILALYSVHVLVLLWKTLRGSCPLMGQAVFMAVGLA
jgi:hypothetical protein